MISARLLLLTALFFPFFSSGQAAADSLPTSVKALIHFSDLLLQQAAATTFSGNPGERFAVFDRTFNRNPDWQKKPFLIQTDATVPLRLARGLAGKFMGAAFLEPRLVVRIFQTDSAAGDLSYPVRTPSYLPSGSIFITHQRLWPVEKPVKQFFYLKIWHHSNGQDAREIAPDGWFNTYNGTFAVRAAAEFGYGLFVSRKRAVSFQRKTPALLGKGHRRIEQCAAREHLWHFRIGYEHIGDRMVNGRLVHYQTYGQQRLNWSATWQRALTHRSFLAEKTSETMRLRAAFRSSYILGALNAGPVKKLAPVRGSDAARRLNLTATVHFNPLFLPRLAVFAQGGYYGSDPYNAYFQQSLWFYRVGISAGIFSM